MKTVNIHEAKTQLSKLLSEVAQGHEIVIAKAGKPIAKLTKYRQAGEIAAARRAAMGSLRGKIWIADDFDAPDPEIERMFYGDEP